jgi:putative ABC transport system permease protein
VTATLFGSSYELDVHGVVADFPGLPSGSDRFVVLTWPYRSAAGTVAPTGFLVAGEAVDPDALRAVADDAQLSYARTVLGQTVPVLANPSVVTTRAAYREGLDRTGANELLTFAFTVGAVGASTLAVLAVGFVVLAQARSRGQLLSRLRTLGLPGRLGQGVLVVELVPPFVAAVLTGALVGTLLPTTLAPALRLELFTAGVAPGTAASPALVVGVLGLLALALGTAVVVENVVHRRLRPGAARPGGEDR